MEQLRCGLIGTGTQGCILLRHLTTIADACCVALCDIYPPNLGKALEIVRTPPAAYDDHRRILERDDIEAVIIATPLYLHAPMAIEALEAGKHVLVEKMLFFKEEEEERLRHAAAVHPERVLQVGLQRRSSIVYQVAIDMARKGALGTILMLRAEWHRNSDWRRPVFDPRYEQLLNWRMYRSRSGGLMAELASHQLDVASWVIGAEPSWVMASGGINYWHDGRETADNVQAIFAYPGGQKLIYSSLLFNEHDGLSEQIIGSEGTLEITTGRGMYFRENNASPARAPTDAWWAGATIAERRGQRGVPIFPEPRELDDGFVRREIRHARRWLATLGIHPYDEPHDPYWSELYNFIASIRGGAPIAAPLEVGAANARAAIYANRAIETGEKVVWPATR